MSAPFDLILRQVRPNGGPLCDVGIAAGKISAIDHRIDVRAPEIECAGQELRPGIRDHHIHLLATAAQSDSIDLRELTDANETIAKLTTFASSRVEGRWIRATGYDERAAGMIDRRVLDQWCPAHPLRVQDRTGALWILNSSALAKLGDAELPACVERWGDGQPTGRIWRGDAWLRERLGAHPPSLRSLSEQLAAFGVVGVTDASATNGRSEAKLFEQKINQGEIRQSLCLMGNEDLPESAYFTRGALKLLYDERDLPDVDAVATRIQVARDQQRQVAAHCVSLSETLLFLDALETAGGTCVGDRMEHGSVLPDWLFDRLRASRLTLVLQPGFVRSRGDRYLAEMDPHELRDTQRLGSLAEHGVKLAGSSDAPYGTANPWDAIRAACDRLTADGQMFGPAESIDAERAFALFTGPLDDLANPARIAVGEAADLILLPKPLKLFLADRDQNNVSLTLAQGQLIHQAA